MIDWLVITCLLILCGQVVHSRRRQARPRLADQEDVLLVERGAGGEDMNARHRLAKEDWPHLRGQNHDAISLEGDLIGTWPKGGPEVVWRTRIGQGYSGFAAVGGRLYTQTQDQSGQYLVCLDGTTGRRLWRYRYGWPWELTGDYPGPRATPTWYRGRVYFAGAYGLVGCVNDRSGRLQWSVNVVEAFRGRGTEFGYSCTPLVTDGKVILPVGGEGAAVVALDADDGRVLWRSGNDAASYCGAIPVAHDGQMQAVCFLQNSLVSLEVGTGRELWRHEFSDGYDEHAAWPLYEAPYLLVSSPFRCGSRAYELETVDGGTKATPRWSSEALSIDVLSGVALDGLVFAFDLHEIQAAHTRPSAGEFKCLDLANGDTRWSTTRTGHASVIAADGKLILLNESGFLILARATRDAYDEIGRMQILRDWPCWTQPTLHRGHLYARNQSEAVCVSLGSGPAPRQPDHGPLPVVKTDSRPPARGASLWSPGSLGGESLFAPSFSDIAYWFVWSFAGVWTLSMLITWAACCRGSRGSPVQAPWTAIAVSRGLMLVLGATGLFVFSALAGKLAFTWPAALFAAFTAVLAAAAWDERKPADQRSGTPVRILVFLFLIVCVGYYLLCGRLFIVAGWGFLVGFLPAWPFALIAAKQALVSRHLPRALLWDLLAFVVYFWSSGLFTIWKTHA